MQAIEQFEKFKREDANRNSITTALGWSGLFNSGLFSDGNNKMDPKVLLPFADEISESKESSFSKQTIAIVRDLAKKNKIPQRIFLLLRTIEELKI